MLPQCNNTLTSIGDHLVATEKPLWRNFTFHHFGLLLTAAFAAVATIIALTLMFLHATHYSQPWQQKHIIRILFMIPVYAVVSLISYVFYKHAIYWEVLRDCYEAFAIASFFTLLCHYLEPTLHEQKDYFRRVTPRNWVWPLTWMQKCTGGKERGWLRIPRSGLTWFNVMYVGVFQYCLIRVIFTFVAMITQLFHRYCESSLSPAFGHIWVMVFEAGSVTVAMYCLIQFYIQLKKDLSEHKPFLKILCIKLVIFFSFWQSLLISFLSSSSSPGGAVLKPSEHIAMPDIKIGIPSMLLAVEMSIFAVMHIFAFPYKPYDITRSASPSAKYHGGFLGWKAILDAFNLWDVVKAAARGFRWLFVGVRQRHQDISYEEHRNAMKLGSMDSGAQRPPVDVPSPPFMPMEHRDGRPRPKRQDTTDSDSGAALLASSQGVPKINLREPSPYGYPSRDQSPYSQETGVHRPAAGPFADPQPYGGPFADPRAPQQSEPYFPPPPQQHRGR